MPSWIDNSITVHATALSVRAKRAEILASNLANEDTPGYKARDIDFREVLSSQKQAVNGLRTTDSGHISTVGVAGAALKYRIPTQMSADGNTVESQIEQAQFGENAVRYQASLNFLNGSLKGLMLALRGE